MIFVPSDWEICQDEIDIKDSEGTEAFLPMISSDVAIVVNKSFSPRNYEQFRTSEAFQLLVCCSQPYIFFTQPSVQ